jgi:hypothetical protein
MFFSSNKFEWEKKNLLVKCIEIFLMYIFLIFQSFKWHDHYKFLSLKKKFN